MSAGQQQQQEQKDEAVQIVAGLASASADERTVAYERLEQIVAVSAHDAPHVREASGKPLAVALVTACVRPLIKCVLSAPASKIGVAEW